MNIKVGKFYKTRNGLKVRIYSVDSKDNAQDIHGAYLDEKWCLGTWTWLGFWFEGKSSDKDIVSEWEELFEGWVNIYAGPYVSHPYPTYEEAIESAAVTVTRTILVREVLK